MVAFSPGLEQSLRRATALAAERRHEQAMLDYLLLALTEDEDAAVVMRGCKVDLEQLRGRLQQSLADSPSRSVEKSTIELRAAAELQEVVRHAAEHVESIGQKVVTGAHVLVELLDQWPGSFLQEQGMTRFDAVVFLTHGSAAPTMPPAPSESEDATSLFRVLLLNDDYTPMEFVVHVLERFFDFDHDSAAARMMHVHSHGSMRRLSVRSCRQKGERGGGFRPRESASAALRAAGTRSPTLTSVGVGPSAF
jgi:ATP-dependent Clp protease ATP-binding subunit ClpA